MDDRAHSQLGEADVHRGRKRAVHRQQNLTFPRDLSGHP